MTEPTGQPPVQPGPPTPPYPGDAPAPYQGAAQPYQVPPATAYAQPAYAQPGYQGYPGYQYPAAPQTNQKALIAMILGLVGLFTWITSIPAVVLGHMARKELANSGENGHGMALTGLILGYVVAIGGILFIAAYVIFIVAVVAGSSAY